VQKIRNGSYYSVVTVALLTILVYLPALRNEFVYWDDNLYIFENPHIQSLNASFFRWAFFGFHVSNWHPLTWVSHALDYAVWGLNPLGHHLTNILLHGFNTALVVVLALNLIEAARDRGQRNASGFVLNDRSIMIAAGVTGLLFGIHPVHVESVAWVSERKDLLCALFFLLSMIMYARYAGRVSGEAHGAGSAGETAGTVRFSLFFDRRYLAALGLFILALLSKPMAVTLPVVLLVLDWYPFGRIRSWKTLWQAGFEKFPFLALSFGSSVLTILAQRAGGAIASSEVVPLPMRLLVAAKSLIAYIGKMVVPVDLIPFYPYPKDVSLASFGYLSALALIVGVTAASVFFAKKQKLWLSAWGYYVVTLLPVLGIMQVGGQAMADRYTYLPSLGPFLITGLMAAAVVEKTGMVKQKGLIVVFTAGSLSILVLLSSFTIGQIGIWRTSMGLWNVVIKREPDKAPLAYYNRGQVFMNNGLFQDAIEDYSTAIKLNPYYEDAYYNRALAFEKSGHPDRAIKDYERAISLNPSNYQAFNNRGVLYGTTGSYDRAIEFFTRALAVNPDYTDSYFNRGITYFLVGRRDEALADFDKTIELNQQFAPAYLNRGKLLLGMNRKEAASNDFRRACELGIREACSIMPQPSSVGR
jgi:Tfp pilus assembly protein PilF